jgi:hypothetical protein
MNRKRPTTTGDVPAVERRAVLAVGAVLAIASALSPAAAARDKMPAALRRVVLGIREHRSALVALSKSISESEAALTQGDKAGAEGRWREVADYSQSTAARMEEAMKAAESCATLPEPVRSIIQQTVVSVVAILVAIYSFGSNDLQLVSIAKAKSGMRNALELMATAEKAVAKEAEAKQPARDEKSE